MLWKTLCPKP